MNGLDRGDQLLLSFNKNNQMHSLYITRHTMLTWPFTKCSLEVELFFLNEENIFFQKRHRQIRFTIDIYRKIYHHAYKLIFYMSSRLIHVTFNYIKLGKHTNLVERIKRYKSKTQNTNRAKRSKS